MRVETALLMGQPVRVSMPRQSLDRIGRVPGMAAASPQLYLGSPARPLLMVTHAPHLVPQASRVAEMAGRTRSFGRTRNFGRTRSSGRRPAR